MAQSKGRRYFVDIYLIDGTRFSFRFEGRWRVRGTGRAIPFYWGKTPDSINDEALPLLMGRIYDTVPPYLFSVVEHAAANDLLGRIDVHEGQPFSQRG